MIDNEILIELEQCFANIKSAYCTTTRKKYGQRMITIITNNPQIKEYWLYNPNEFLWINKFKKIKDYHYSVVKIENGIVKDPTTNLLTAPSIAGLYLLGQTSFNPYTKEEQYWVKVGWSSDIWYRFKKGYATHCPCTALIDVTTKSNEVKCHNILQKVSLGRCQINTEWWLVDKDTYLKISEEKFNYFFD